MIVCYLSLVFDVYLFQDGANVNKANVQHENSARLKKPACMTVPNDSINSLLWTSPLCDVIRASSPVTLVDAYAVIRSTPLPVTPGMCICHIRNRACQCGLQGDVK